MNVYWKETDNRQQTVMSLNRRTISIVLNIYDGRSSCTTSHLGDLVDVITECHGSAHIIMSTCKLWNTNINMENKGFLNERNVPTNLHTHTPPGDFVLLTAFSNSPGGGRFRFASSAKCKQLAIAVASLSKEQATHQTDQHTKRKPCHICHEHCTLNPKTLVRRCWLGEYRCEMLWLDQQPWCSFWFDRWIGFWKHDSNASVCATQKETPDRQLTYDPEARPR